MTYRSEKIICPYCHATIDKKLHSKAIEFELDKHLMTQDWYEYIENGPLPEDPHYLEYDQCNAEFGCYISFRYEFTTFAFKNERYNDNDKHKNR